MGFSLSLFKLLKIKPTMSTAIRILIKVVVAFIIMFVISAIQMTTGLPHFIAAFAILAALRAIWRWQPGGNQGTSIDNEELKKD